MGEAKVVQKMEEEELTIDLKVMFQALWKKAWLIALVGVVCGVLMFAGTHLLVTPQYRSSFTAYVNNRTNQEDSVSALSSGDISASQALVKTYSAVISSRTVLEEASSVTNCPYSYDELASMVDTSAVDSTQLIKVSVTMPDPEMAQQVAKAISEVAAEYITQIVEGSSMRVVDDPVVPKNIYSPSYSRNALLGVLLGLVLCAGVIVLKEMLDDKVKDSATLTSRYNLPLIGTIPDITAAEKIGDNYAYSKKKSGGKR